MRRLLLAIALPVVLTACAEPVSQSPTTATELGAVDPSDAETTMSPNTSGAAERHAPLTGEEQASAAGIALADERLREFLGDHPPAVVGVRRPKAGGGDGEPDAAVVTIEFDEPLPLDAWPLDQCAFGHDNPHLTGVVWLVHLGAGRVSAVSPKWGDVACGY